METPRLPSHPSTISKGFQEALSKLRLLRRWRLRPGSRGSCGSQRPALSFPTHSHAPPSLKGTTHLSDGTSRKLSQSTPCLPKSWVLVKAGPVSSRLGATPGLPCSTPHPHNLTGSPQTHGTSAGSTSPQGTRCSVPAATCPSQRPKSHPRGEEVGTAVGADVGGGEGRSG